MTDLAAQIGVKSACEAWGVPRSRVYREGQGRVPSEPKVRLPPAPALSSVERVAVRETLHSERFMDKAPRQVYASLLDEGIYLCHWRTMYRILAVHDAVRERRHIRRHPAYQKPELLSTPPNPVWSWDSTVLRGPYQWVHYPLDTVLDIFSRDVVGWMIAEHESSDLARQLIDETAHTYAIQPDQLTLHADNGAPLKGQPLSHL